MINKRELKKYRYSVSYGAVDYGAQVFKGRSRKPVLKCASLCDLVLYLATLGLTIGKNNRITRKEQ